jgi:hypothetical protein
MGVYLYTPVAGKRFKAMDELSHQYVTIFPMEYQWKYYMSFWSGYEAKEEFHLARIHRAARKAVESKHFEGLVSEGIYDGARVYVLDQGESGWSDCDPFPGTMIGTLVNDQGWKIMADDRVYTNA